MAEPNWRDAIIQVLKKKNAAMDYNDIAEAIAEQQIKTKLGATPARTVSSTITSSIKIDALKSPFERVAPGHYRLRADLNAGQTPTGQFTSPITSTEDETKVAGLINAFGMYWSRANIDWKPAKPKMHGQQQMGSTPQTGSTLVDFCEQRGVYLLHDGREVIYVGRTTEQPLGVRLRQHTYDRLNGRWDRFSWFGVFAVEEKGTLKTKTEGPYTLDMLIATMEALLIEGVEPPQNRKKGDDFRAVEFIQAEDPAIQKTQLSNLLDEIKKKL